MRGRVRLLTSTTLLRTLLVTEGLVMRVREHGVTEVIVATTCARMHVIAPSMVVRRCLGAIQAKSAWTVWSLWCSSRTSARAVSTDVLWLLYVGLSFHFMRAPIFK